MKTSEKNHSFFKTSLILWTSTHLTLKTICSWNTAKNLSHFTTSSANMLLYSVKKKSASKANVCIFLYISLKKFLFQRCSKILGGGIARGQRLNNFLKASCYLGLAKCTIFHFNLNFWKFNYFSAFLYCIYSIKTLKFSRQFWTLRVILWLNFSNHFSLNIKYDNKITAQTWDFSKSMSLT